jgi:hypothetical protein
VPGAVQFGHIAGQDLGAILLLRATHWFAWLAWLTRPARPTAASFIGPICARVAAHPGQGMVRGMAPYLRHLRVFAQQNKLLEPVARQLRHKPLDRTRISRASEGHDRVDVA